MQRVVGIVDHRGDVDYQISVFKLGDGFCYKWICLSCKSGGNSGTEYKSPSAAVEAARDALTMHDVEMH